MPLQILIVGAGLGGLSAAISISLAGHSATVLESAKSLGEVGAGIQVLPNATRILTSWGLRDALRPHADFPERANTIGWRGNAISSMDFEEHAQKYGDGSGFWNFHRADLHRCLLDRALSLGAKVLTSSRVVDVVFGDVGGQCEVVLHDGRRMSADLVVGADGVGSRMRECLLGRPDPPIATGDLAYRILFDMDSEEIAKDEELREFVKRREINYWFGHKSHAVSYHLKGGKQLNIVLLAPDDIPDGGATTVSGNVREMREVFKGWDPRIGKLLEHCTQVQKWKLLIRDELPTWSHPSGTFTLLGDSAHATLPYLASGAGMSFEDSAVLGECLARVTVKGELRAALQVYETCRKARTTAVVQRSNVQQYLYHLPDGEEQRERDRRMQEVPTREGECLAWRDPGFAGWLLGYDVKKDVERNWVRVSRGEELGERGRGRVVVRSNL